MSAITVKDETAKKYTELEHSASVAWRSIQKKAITEGQPLDKHEKEQVEHWKSEQSRFALMLHVIMKQLFRR